MKNSLCLLVFAVLLSCSTDKTYEQLRTENADVKTSTGALTGVIGSVDRVSGKIAFRQSQETLVASFNSMLKTKSGIAAQLERVSIEETYSGDYYLRGYGKKYKSTMVLQNDGYGNLVDGGVTCTTSTCTTTHGCEAKTDGTCSYCSDCTKTSTGGY